MASVSEMCTDCKSQLSAGRHPSPHRNLKKSGPIREFRVGGLRGDEEDFVCVVCGQQWMYEDGNGGFGWMTR